MASSWSSLEVDLLIDSLVREDVMAAPDPRDLKPDRSGQPEQVLERDVLNVTVAAALEQLGRSHRSRKYSPGVTLPEPTRLGPDSEWFCATRALQRTKV